MNHFKLHHPFHLIIAGSSGVGKTTLLGDIISKRNKSIDAKIDKIIYCAKYETSIPKSIRNESILSFHEGVPTEEMIRNDANENVLFCLDDLLEVAFSSEIVSNMFTQGRNRNTSVILITQNLFPSYPKARNVSLNASGLILYRNIRDASSIHHLAKQVCPSHSKEFAKLFLNNINRPYSYLFLDFTPTTPDVFRYRENILSDYPTVYINDTEVQKLKKYGTCSETPAYSVELPEFH